MNPFKLLRFSVWTLGQKRGLSWSPEKIRSVQQRRFRRMLRLVVERSAFYRDKYRGLDLERCSVSDLPIITKAEVMERFDDLVTDPRVRRADVEHFLDDPENVSRKFLDQYAVCHTSGSQGQPLILLQDDRELEVIFALQLTRGNVRRPGILDALRRLREPARLAVIAMRRGFFPSNAVWTHLPDAVRPYVQLLRLTPTDPDLVEQLNAFRPTAITAYPSTLDVLALQKNRLQLAPELQQVVSTSEELTEAAWERFREVFGVPVVNTYSMAECNHLSAGCPVSVGAHINADWAIVEPVDENNDPVPAGEPCHHLLITNLANEIQPLLRYEIRDRVVLGGNDCACGNRMPKLERIEGRATEYFWMRVADGYKQVPSFVFKNGLEPAREVREWQAVQRGRNEVLLRLELLPGKTLSAEQAREFVLFQARSLGLAEALDLRVEFVPTLTPDARTGKMRRIISEVGPPEDLEEIFQRGTPVPA